MDAEQLAELVGGSAAIVTVCVGFFEGIGRALGRVARRAGARRPTTRAILETARILGVGIAAIGVVTYTGLASVLTVLTLSGLIGLVLSLALQATLSNVVSGILLLSDRLIRFDDEVTYGAIHGRVIRVALRSTWIATDAGAIAVGGNTNLLNGPLINHTASPQFAARFHDPPPAA